MGLDYFFYVVHSVYWYLEPKINIIPKRGKIHVHEKNYNVMKTYIERKQLYFNIQLERPQNTCIYLKLHVLCILCDF